MTVAAQQLLERLADQGATLGLLRGESRPLYFDDAAGEYASLALGVGVAAVFDVTSIDVTGGDRATLLHNMCTADVNRLKIGTGCETLFTNAQGHTVGYGWLYCREDAITIDLIGGDAAELVAQLDRYIIREDVTLTNRAAELATLLVAGAGAGELLAALGCDAPNEVLAHGETAIELTDADARVGDAHVFVRRVELAGDDSFLLSVDVAHIGAIWETITAAGARRCGCAAVETRRIERGIPLFGVDITSDNLPQEVARDQRAISFTKGCYIGQETVARIDALGHVNRTLGGLKFDGETSGLSGGDELVVDGKTVAKVTSVTQSPALGATLAMAYIRRGHQQPGTRLETDRGVAEVIALSL